jgi:2,4-dienoyl-CoA reductase-like NADH-dependent reductase (Old Yellow Enzyme family)
MFDKLFSPLCIGNVEIKNRIQITPHEQQYLENGLPTETMIHYYIERAKGGAGLLEVSQIYIKAPFGIGLPDWKFDSARRFPFVSRSEIVPGLRKLADSIHDHGARIFMEVSAWSFLYGPVSAVPFESGISLNELTLRDMKQIQEDFASASKLVKDSGFDGVDLHGTHGALLEHFYSPAMNKRTDSYGGTLENRLRFILELIEVVRSTIGDSLALGMRMCADEKIDGGVTPDYATKAAKILDGRLDFLNVDMGSVSNYEAMDQHAFQTQPLYVETGYGTYMSEPIKKSLRKTRVGIAGRITDPLLADSIIERGQADYVGMTRALIADPYLPKKAFEGRIEDIRPCIGTLQDCWGRSVAREWPMRCTVNPSVGFEAQRAIGSLAMASKRKKILIIGAGPAGLEAARITSERGHEVVIYEKEGEIGGQVRWAKLLPGRSDIGAILHWYSTQLKKNGVRLEMRKEVPVDESVIEFLVREEERPDAVIIATGSLPIANGIQMITFSEIPGWDSPNVRTIDQILSAGESLSGKVIVADSTTLIEGPGIAEWLSRKGSSEVSLITPHPHIAPEISRFNQLVHVSRRLSNAKVRVIPFSWLRSIGIKKTVIYNIPTGMEEQVDADYVVLNTGRKQVRDLFHLLRKFVSEVYEIGDCNIAGGRIGGAVEAGYEIGSVV